MGVSPAQGLVVCLESDGCIALEATIQSGECGGCTEHASALESDAPALLQPQPACACVDIPVFDLRGGDQSQPRSTAHFVQLATPPLLPAPLPLVAWTDTQSVSPRFDSPRPPPSLPHIRTVVLRT
jgi:hypothetical protein